MPLSGNIATSSGIPAYMSRVNFMKPEPGGSGRLWVCDLNGNIHLFDPDGSFASRSAQLLDQAKTRSAYLDFNGQSATVEAAEKAYVPNATGTSTSAQAPDGLFPLFTKKQGYANGVVTFAFDPGYATNGKFYTVHIETNSLDGTAGRGPVTTKFPGFNASGYTPTPRVLPPGTNVTRQAILIEWTDTERSNLTFEGTARELLRLGYNSHIHPLGDITFHPTVQPGDPEWGVMYLASGDGGSGETNSTRMNPQRLDSMVGKILRIIPDLSLHGADSTLSANGRYRIPNDNPFTNAASYPGARKEIWTLGHRNPHRFAWRLPEAGGGEPVLLVTEIGLNAWEEVNFLKKGKNYGYSEREGPQKLTISASSPVTGSLPSPDTLPVRISNLQNAPGEFVPEYPVIAYPHTAAYGDAISNGFIYRGSGIPALQGKFIFGDITTGRLFYCDWSAMLAADDGNAASTAAPQAITLKWDDPNDSPDAGTQSYDRFFEIVEAGYDFRGGVDSDLPGGATISGTGRADIRLTVDGNGEMYVTSKSDGIIRMLSGPVRFTDQPDDEIVTLGANASFAVAAAGDAPPTYQWQRRAADSEDWLNVANGSGYSGAATPTLSVVAPDYDRSGDQYRCIASSAGASVISDPALLVVRAIPLDWLSTYFNASERANLAISGDMADPDQDGLVNLFEYAFAFNPETNSSASLPKLAKSGTNATLTFPVPRSTLNYTVERSTDLVNWSTSGVTTSTQAGNMTASCPMSGNPKAFLRILVEPK